MDGVIYVSFVERRKENRTEISVLCFKKIAVGVDNGMNGVVRVMATDGNKLYLAGQFTGLKDVMFVCANHFSLRKQT